MRETPVFGLTHGELLGWGACVAAGLAFGQAAVFHRGRSALAALVVLWVWGSTHGPLAAGFAPALSWHAPLLAVGAPLLLLRLAAGTETVLSSAGSLAIVGLLVGETAVARWLPPEHLAALLEPLQSAGFSRLPGALPAPPAWLDRSFPVAALGVAGTGVAGLRWLRTRDPVLAGLAVAAAAVAVVVRGDGASLPALAWLLAAGCALLLTVGWAGYRMAFLDPLTGLPGRRPLEERLARLGRQWAVAMVDVDHFKQFNDRYGHDVGDQVLRMVAACLRRHFGGSAYRYGGEEFTVVFPGHQALLAAARCDAFRADLERRGLVVRSRPRPRKKPAGARRSPRRGREEVGVTVSVGVAQRARGLARPAAVLEAADKALYAAKRGGRNRVVDADAPPKKGREKRV
jgi:diguanylate cyclase (GGDEF)-like protein